MLFKMYLNSKPPLPDNKGKVAKQDKQNDEVGHGQLTTISRCPNLPWIILSLVHVNIFAFFNAVCLML